MCTVDYNSYSVIRVVIRVIKDGPCVLGHLDFYYTDEKKRICVSAACITMQAYDRL